MSLMFGLPAAKGIAGIIGALGSLTGTLYAPSDPVLSTYAMAFPPIITNAHDVSMGVYSADGPETFNGNATTYIPVTCTASGPRQCSALAVTFQVIIDNFPSGISLNQRIHSTDRGAGSSQSLAMVVQILAVEGSSGPQTLSSSGRNQLNAIENQMRNLTLRGTTATAGLNTVLGYAVEIGQTLQANLSSAASASGPERAAPALSPAFSSGPSIQTVVKSNL